MRSWPDLSDPSCVKHEDAISEPREQSWIVGNENHCKTECLPKLPEELQNFQLRCGIERRRRFIGNNERRPASNGLRDQHSLALPSAQFVRIRASDTFGIDGEHRCKKLVRPFGYRAAIQGLVGSHNVSYLLIDSHSWMKGGRRLLQD